MVASSWAADGRVSSYTGGGNGLNNPLAGEGRILPQHTATVADANYPTRLQYDVAGDTVKAVVGVNVSQEDFWAAVDPTGLGLAYDTGRRATLTVFLLPYRLGQFTGVPTSDQIRRAVEAGYGFAFRASAAFGLTDASAAGWVFGNTSGTSTALFETTVPRGTIRVNTKYWLLALPTEFNPLASARQDKPLGTSRVLKGFSGTLEEWEAEVTTLTNSLGRGISLWGNRPPPKPVITSPPNEEVFSSGVTQTLTFTLPNNGDAVTSVEHGADLDLSGVQVEYSAVPSSADPTPLWRPLPFAASGGITDKQGWHIDRRGVAGPAGAQALWQNQTVPLKGGTSAALTGAAHIPTGRWRIRLRVFDYGHPRSATHAPFVVKGTFASPAQAPETNTSPWSDPITVTVMAQVPAPVPLRPAPHSAVEVGKQFLIQWQYRNTAPQTYDQSWYQVWISGPGLPVTGVERTTAENFHWLVPSEYDLQAGKQYTWRVRVMDTTNYMSDWSPPVPFWVVPQPRSGEIKSVETGLDSATLGSGTHTAHIYRRGGQHKVMDLAGLTRIGWERKRDDVSVASVRVEDWTPDMGHALSQLQTWAYELVIYRNNGYTNDRVWEGPITRISYHKDKVEIEARDAMAILSRRIIKEPLHDNRVGASVVSRALRVAQAALAPDDPNLLSYIHVTQGADDATQYRSLQPYSRTAFEEIDDMAANSGLDYTVVGRSILFWGTRNAVGRLPEFRDSDLGDSVIVTEYGMRLATHYAVSDGAGVWGDAYAPGLGHGENGEGDEVINPQAGVDPSYGLLEHLSSTWATDAEDSSGDPYTEEAKEKARKSFREMSEKSIADRYPPPVIVRVPENVSVQPGAPVSIQHLVPGVAIPLQSNGTVRTVRTVQKLDSVHVVEEAGKETISIVMSPFARLDESLEDLE